MANDVVDMIEGIPYVSSLGGTSYDRIRDVLRSHIVNGLIKSGERLKVADLAAQYGVSQIPVREALQQLKGEGLIEIKPNHGARVRQIDAKFIADIFEIRETISALLAGKAALRMTDSGIAELCRRQDELEKAIEERSTAAILQIDSEFHHLHMAVSDNVEAANVIERHWSLLQVMRIRSGYSDARLRIVRDEHRALINAFKSRDVKQAEEISRIHARGSRDDLLDQLSRADRLA